MLLESEAVGVSDVEGNRSPDLVFCNRLMRSFFAIYLKNGKVTAGDVGPSRCTRIAMIGRRSCRTRIRQSAFCPGAMSRVRG